MRVRAKPVIFLGFSIWLLLVFSLTPAQSDEFIQPDFGPGLIEPLIEKFQSPANTDSDQTSVTVEKSLFPSENNPKPQISGYIDWKSGHYVVRTKIRRSNLSREIVDDMFVSMLLDTRINAEQKLGDLVLDISQVKNMGNLEAIKLFSQRQFNENGLSYSEAEYRLSMRGKSGVMANIHRLLSPPAEAGLFNHMDKSLNLAPAVELLIDARGTGIRPAFFPRIEDNKGNVLFDSALTVEQDVLQIDYVEYVLEKALQPEKNHSVFLNKQILMDEPPKSKKRRKRKVIRATSATGVMQSNIIISAEDARKLRKDKKNGLLTGPIRLLVVTDGTTAGTEGRLDSSTVLMAFLSEKTKIVR